MSCLFIEDPPLVSSFVVCYVFFIKFFFACCYVEFFLYLRHVHKDLLNLRSCSCSALSAVFFCFSAIPLTAYGPVAAAAAAVVRGNQPIIDHFICLALLGKIRDPLGSSRTVYINNLFL